MKLIDRHIERWSSSLHSAATQRLFVRSIFVFLFVDYLYLWPIRGLVWGEASLLKPLQQPDSLVVNLAAILDHERAFALPAYYLMLAASLWCAFGFRGQRALRLAVFALSLMLYYAAMPVFNASLLLFHLFVFFSLGMDEDARTPARRLVSNVAFAAARLQLVLVYAVAAGYKWSGTMWPDGSAVYYALMLDRYDALGVGGMLAGKWSLLSGFTYMGLAYQTAFPVLIWVKRFRTPLLIAAVTFHGFIAVVLNLPDFGIAMIIAYTVFLPNRYAEWILKLPNRISGKHA